MPGGRASAVAAAVALAVDGEAPESFKIAGGHIKSFAADITAAFGFAMAFL